MTLTLFVNYYSFLINIVHLEYDCPDDGKCSNQGICDDTTGKCICNEGFEGATCKGIFISLNFNSK